MNSINLLLNEKRKLEEEIVDLEKENALLREKCKEIGRKVVSQVDLKSDCLKVSFLEGDRAIEERVFPLKELEDIVRKIKF